VRPQHAAYDRSRTNCGCRSQNHTFHGSCGGAARVILHSMEAAHTALAGVLENAGWPRDLAQEIARHSHVVTYERNATVFHTGEPADLLYVLLAGDVKLYFSAPDDERLLVAIARGARVLAFPDLEPGEPRGVEAKQFFTAQTLSRCTVAIMTRARVAAAL